MTHEISVKSGPVRFRLYLNFLPYTTVSVIYLFIGARRARNGANPAFKTAHSLHVSRQPVCHATEKQRETLKIGCYVLYAACGLMA